MRLSPQNFCTAAVSQSRMRALGLVVSMFATGCASAVEADALEVPEAPVRVSRHDAVVPSEQREASADPPQIDAGPRCDVREDAPTRMTPVVAPDDTTKCRVVPPKLARSVRASVRKAWMRMYPTGTLAIGSGCDRLGEITRIDLERSSGHGGSLTLARFELDAASGEWSLLWIGYSHYADYPGEDADVWQSDTIRELFAHRFWSARDRGEDYGKWFLRERFIALAGALGGDEHVPELLRTVAADGDSSVARSRVQAINAITAITGFDRRYEHGVARDPVVVAREVTSACSAPW